jgi:SAM-dependent methyltransferase
MDASELARELGGMDIYLLDQVLKARFRPGSRVLDAGAGSGRNIAWFGRNGFDVHALDHDPLAIARLNDFLPPGKTRQALITDLPYEDAAFDLVLCIAVLHFLPDQQAFERALDELWRVLAPNGMLFARLGTTISMQGNIRQLQGWRHLLPDGHTEWLLPGLGDLHASANRLGARVLEPIKTSNVENQRAMTTLVLAKP